MVGLVEDIVKEIKQVKKNIDSIQLELSALESRKQTLSKDLNQAKQEFENLKKKQEKVARLSKLPHVTDHAIVRYLERRFNIDIDDIKKEILSEELVTKVRALGGNCNYQGIVVKDNTVITVRDIK
jgi:chromosome segregation ATPase